MQIVHKNMSLTDTDTISPIVRILSYFSLFNYPLLAEEIRKYLPVHWDDNGFTTELRSLEHDGYIFRLEEFYSIVNDPKLVSRRREGNLRATRLLRKARRIGKFLSLFPFVRGVAISGSLSKNFADEKADIDFFVITNTNRLWIARTVMHLFKKLTFLTGHQNLFCMNYFLDQLALEIPDQNIYTAIEVSTLIPVGGSAMPDFFNANRWVRNWVPGHPAQSRKEIKESRPLISRITEYLLNSDRLDNICMNITARRWSKKMSVNAKNSEGRRMNLEMTKHSARSNPGRFQENLLDAYQELLGRFKLESRRVIFSSVR